VTQTRLVRRDGVLQNGRAIRAIRVRRGLNRSQAAGLIGCHPKALAHLEYETRGASDVMISRIASAFDVEPAEITRQLQRAVA
jgi:transcriptional regulator with XRE-family HTH domain